MEEKDINIEVEETNEKKSKKISHKEYAALQEQFEKAMATAAHHQNLSKYYQAEYDKMIKYRSQSLIETLIPTLDAFELAFKYQAPTPEAEAYKSGFQYLYKMLFQALEGEGLTTLNAVVGQEFDSDTMQVVDVIETEEEDKINKVAESLLSGYKLKDRLLRAANVKIYVKVKENEEEKTIDQNDQEEVKN